MIITSNSPTTVPGDGSQPATLTYSEWFTTEYGRDGTRSTAGWSQRVVMVLPDMAQSILGIGSYMGLSSWLAWPASWLGHGAFAPLLQINQQYA
ncbi:hypothetical protein DTO271D3_449 [Paecilomyces variotii]|nr:hypothetical protein DTO271D3_449 [Paecilomyces variotii]